MDVLGTHRVSWEAVRRLAIECHALDSAVYPLLTDSILDDKAGKNRITYEELFTEKLLALAIALRTKFYQVPNPPKPHGSTATTYPRPGRRQRRGRREWPKPSASSKMPARPPPVFSKRPKPRSPSSTHAESRWSTQERWQSSPSPPWPRTVPVGPNRLRRA